MSLWGRLQSASRLFLGWLQQPYGEGNTLEVDSSEDEDEQEDIRTDRAFAEFETRTFNYNVSGNGHLFQDQVEAHQDNAADLKSYLERQFGSDLGMVRSPLMELY
jgi:hypothetical protein